MPIITDTSSFKPGSELWRIEYPHDPKLRHHPESSKAVAYPIEGGIVIGHFSPIELLHLDIPRFEPAKRSPPGPEEDDAALRMLQMGGHWWPSWEFYARHTYKMMTDGLPDDPYGFHYPPNIEVGYPKRGGVLVLKISEDADKAKYAPQVDPEDPEPIAPLEDEPTRWASAKRQVLTMEERCELLQESDARWYSSIDECPDLPTTLEDGIRRGRKFVERLGRMDNEEYVEKWWEEVSRRENAWRRDNLRWEDFQ